MAQGWTPARGCAQQGARVTEPWWAGTLFEVQPRGCGHSWLGGSGGAAREGPPGGHTWGPGLCWQKVAEGTRALLGEAGGSLGHAAGARTGL